MNASRFLALIASVAIVAACGGGTSASPAPAASGTGAAVSSYPTKAIDIMAPAATGGGFDTTARLVQKALTEEKIVSQNVTVSNVPGSGGVVGLGQLIKQDDKEPDKLFVVGAVTDCAQANQSS